MTNFLFFLDLFSYQFCLFCTYYAFGSTVYVVRIYELSVNFPSLLLTFKVLKCILYKKPVFRFTPLKIKVLALDSIYILQGKKYQFLAY